MYLNVVLAAFAGFMAGILVGFLFRIRGISHEIVTTLKGDENLRHQNYMSQMESAIGDVALKSLQHTSHVASDIAKQKLLAEGETFQKDVYSLNQQIGKMTELVHSLEKDRGQKFGELTTMIQNTSDQTQKLHRVTGQLHSVLANSQSRGQWGERLAEDVLRTAGFIEGISYGKQVSQEGCRPDYTFYMPSDLWLNMDVKFPIDNFIRMLDSSENEEKSRYQKLFNKDVKARIKEVGDRNYIHDKTVDCVLLLIPNEQIYSYLHQSDPGLFEEALKQKIVVCSPLTLFAVLTVIHQAIDHFAVEKTAGEILKHMQAFRKQWDLYQKCLESMGKKIDDASQEFHKLTTTRDRMLTRTLEKIDALKIDESSIPQKD